MLIMRITMSILAPYALSFILPFSLGVNDDSKGEKLSEYYNVPVMKVNFYMMGQDEIDAEVPLKIWQNMEVLNSEFEGKVQFVFNELFLDPAHVYLPDLYHNYIVDNDPVIEDIVRPIESKGGINVFLFKTYCALGKGAALMGFTPVLKMSHNSYKYASPHFDRIFMAYDGLDNNSTLVHEMGHFLGLKHPWELTPTEQARMGLRDHKTLRNNHMNYDNEEQDFTHEQLEKMRLNALNYRTYLLDRIVRVYYKS